MAIKLPTLTPREINTLQVDAALRLVGQYSTLLVQANEEVTTCLIKYGKAKINLECAKERKKTIGELIRALKVVASNA